MNLKKNASNNNIIMMVESDGGTFPDPGGSSTIEREEHRYVLAWPSRCCSSTVPYSRKEGLKHPESAAGTECLNWLERGEEKEDGTITPVCRISIITLGAINSLCNYRHPHPNLLLRGPPPQICLCGFCDAKLLFLATSSAEL